MDDFRIVFAVQMDKHGNEIVLDDFRFEHLQSSVFTFILVLEAAKENAQSVCKGKQKAILSPVYHGCGSVPSQSSSFR